MVEKNVAYNRGNRAEEFADNDPLAELARVVGYEDRPSHVVSAAAPRTAPPTERREPEFNLEDELLREFEIYDAPRYEPVVLDPANDARAPVPAEEFMQRVESVFARKEPELEPVVEHYQPATTEDFLPEANAISHEDFSRERSDDLRNDFQDDPESVAAVFDVNHRVAPQSPPEPVYVAPVHVEPPVEVQHVAEPTPESVVAEEWNEIPAWPAAVAQAEQEPNFEQMAETSSAGAIDLASELEMSVAEEAPQPVRAPSGSGRSSLEFSSLRLPLANFGAPRATPVAPAPVAPEPVLAVEPEPVAEVHMPVAPANHAEPAYPAEPMSAMDELIYDVGKYSISSRDVPASLPVGRLEPVVEVAAPVVAQPEPSVAADSVIDDFDSFKDEDFELALDDIDFDIDLSEIGEIDLAPEAPVQAAAPQPVAPVYVPPVAAAPVVAAGVPVARPHYEERPAPRAAAVPAPVETLESLPFDPSQIGETEDQPETISELDVPELPVGVFEPKPAPRRQEEDLDIDTELAALFAPAVSGGLDRNKNADGRNVAPRAPAPTPEEMDEFERALEQDFRRSMQEAAESRANGTRTAQTALGQTPVRYEDEERGSRRWLMPVAAALGLVLIGGGTYALMFGGSSSQGSNGAPVVISADNDPMKVVPENPGGRVVPNQDKAVYDRVAGGTAADPKQPSLISTSEEPVDVVQRTLIPEQLPLEGENDEDMDVAGTPVGETEDPRLLSPEEKAQATANNNGSAVNVSPRKVRTMIVKPDGTLVAQEVDAPAVAQTPQADKVEELAAPQTGRPPENAPAVLQSSPVNVAAQQPAPAAQTPPAATQPARQTAAPMPAARPAAQQPATVAAATPAQANARPAATPPAAAAQQPAPAATTATSSGGYYMQVASLPSEAEAQRSYQNLSAKFGSVIGGRGVDIKRADIAGKGTYYRVRIPAGDKNEAAALCERFRSAGGSCLIAR
jgi:hypothetical protein